jgi:hypothetical protein
LFPIYIMSFKQAVSISSGVKNVLGDTFTIGSTTDVILGASPYADPFYSQNLQAGVWNFSCNYILENVDASDCEISKLEFSVTSGSQDFLSSYIQGLTLGEDEQWSFWLDRTFAVESGGSVSFGVQTTYAGGEPVRTSYNIRLLRIG